MSERAGKMESIKAPDGRYDAYIAGESGGRRPGLIIFTPIFGVDEDMMNIADEWAAEGSLVAVPDYYFRVKPGALDRSEEGRKQAMERWKKLDVDRTLEDMRPLVERVRGSAVCNGKWAALGFCAGGELAFLASTRLGADAMAGFHATHIHKHLEEAGNARGPISLHYGAADPLVPVQEVAKVKSALLDNPLAEIHLYDGAQHGFSFKNRPSYHELAATRSRKRAKELLNGLK
jgi:carboxymethylenebutenolidase